MVIVWSTPAKHDLRNIHHSIAEGSHQYANRIVGEFHDKVSLLLELPRMGRVVPQIGVETIREVSLYSYRIMYEIMTDTIYIHGIFHKRQNFKADDIVR